MVDAPAPALTAPTAPDRRWLDAAVLLALAALFGVSVWQRYEPYTFLHGDGAFYANINRTIRADLGLAQGEVHPRTWIESDLGWNRDLDQGWSNVSLGADGETWWPKHPVLLPIVSTPLYVLLGMPGLLVFNVLQTVLLLFFAYRAAARLAPAAFAALATLALATSPVFLEGAYSYSNDLFYGLLVVAGVDALLGARWATAGALLGMAVWAKVTNGLFVLPVGIWLLVRERWRGVLRFGVGFAVPVGLFALSNWVMFGAPWATSYDRILIRQGGHVALESARVRFNVPFGPGLRRLILDDHAGVWKNAPLFLVALPGLLPLFRRRLWLAATVVVSLAGFLWFYARYDYLYARFFLPWAGLGVVLGAVGLDGLGGLAAALGARVPTRVRRLALPVAGSALALAVAGTWLAQAALAPPARDLVDRVESARVFLGDLPCDYFNPAHQKFECSHAERHDWEYAGRSLGRQCTVDGAPRSMLWLHPSPSGRPKRLVFPDLPPSAAVTLRAVRVGDRPGAATLTVTADGEPLGSVSLAGPGADERAEWRAPALADGGEVEIRLSGPGQGAGRGVCLDVRVESP